MTIDELRKQLLSESPKLRAAAVKDLARLKSHEAAKILTEALANEPHEKVCELIQKSLQYLKRALEGGQKSRSKIITPKVLEKAKTALSSGSLDDEKKALNFIVRNRCTELLPFLIELASKRAEKSFCLEALNVLQEIGTKERGDDLIEWIKHPDPEIALATLRTYKALDILAEAWHFIPDFLEHSHSDLAGYSQTLLNELAESGHKEAVEVLKERQSKAEKEKEVEPFVPKGMDSDLLPKRKDDAQKEVQEKETLKKKEVAALYHFKRSLESEDPEKRTEAIIEVSSSKDPEAVELIVQLISNEADSTVLATGLSCLGKLGRESAVSSLQNFLSHSDSRVRANAVEGIHVLLGPEKPKPMLEPLLDDPHHRVRSNAILALYATKPKECFLPLNSLVLSKHKDEKTAALRLIKHLQDDMHLGFLHRFFTENEGEVKDRTRDILESWTGLQEVAKFILEKPDGNFQEFFANAMQTHRKLQKSESTNDADPNSETDPESTTATQKAKSNTRSLWSKVMGFFKR
jgi:HEAT repeat protein